MNTRLGWLAVIGAAVLAGVVLVVCVALFFGASVVTRSSSEVAPSDQYASNGQLIYFTGRNQRGERIPFEGGPMWLSNWLYMRGGGCATCHGADGRGTVMMGTEVPSDIRYHHLIEEGHEEGEEHPPYTDELIKEAITMGLNPAGEPLDLTMPRWHMSNQDVEDVLEFLKTLDGEH